MGANICNADNISTARFSESTICLLLFFFVNDCLPVNQVSWYFKERERDHLPALIIHMLFSVSILKDFMIISQKKKFISDHQNRIIDSTQWKNLLFYTATIHSQDERERERKNDKSAMIFSRQASI